MTAQELLDTLLRVQRSGKDLTTLNVVIAELKIDIWRDSYVERTDVTEAGTDIFDNVFELRT